MSKKHLNYFSGSEQGFMKWFEAWRTSLFRPISRLFIFFHVSPNMISYFGLFMLIGFIYFISRDPITALYFLLAHVLIDALDGSLARELKQESDAGALTDIICDHTGMVVVIATLAYYNLVGGLTAIAYVYLYTIMIFFIIILNRIKKPLRITIRTKYFVYLFYAIWAIWGLNYFNQILTIFIILMLPSVLIGFLKLQKQLR